MSIERARALRKTATESEKRLWKEGAAAAEARRLHFRRQPPIGPYYPDFACQREKLIIELDGEPHMRPGQMTHDAERTRFLESSVIVSCGSGT